MGAIPENTQALQKLKQLSVLWSFWDKFSPWIYGLWLFSGTLYSRHKVWRWRPYYSLGSGKKVLEGRLTLTYVELRCCVVKPNEMRCSKKSVIRVYRQKSEFPKVQVYIRYITVQVSRLWFSIETPLCLQQNNKNHHKDI